MANDPDCKPQLERWVGAGLIDSATAERILAYESTRAENPRLRWPVIVALAFGGLLVAAGLSLFVAAHWDELSPFARMATVVAALLVLHGIGAYTAARFPSLSSTMHAVGTIGLGGAIALSGQIFNMAEHWPAAVLLWAVGAWIGYALLRDLPQLTIAAILTPAWIASEFSPRWWNTDLWVPSFLTTTAFAYLSARGPNLDTAWRWLLALLGTIGLLPAVLWVIAESVDSSGSGSSGLWVAFAPVALAIVLRRVHAWPVLAGACWIVLESSLLAKNMDIAAHAAAAAASVALVVWGVFELRKERVNLGVAGFAITVLFFYFGHVMDSIDRSLSLILLGVVFLAGGWQLERLRRRLMQRISGATL